MPVAAARRRERARCAPPLRFERRRPPSLAGPATAIRRDPPGRLVLHVRILLEASSRITGVAAHRLDDSRN